MVATEPEALDRARRRARYLTGLIWHVGAFLIINGAFWLLDAGIGGAVTWAYWITAVWGFGLAFHILAFIVDGRDLERRRAARYLRE